MANRLPHDDGTVWRFGHLNNPQEVPPDGASFDFAYASAKFHSDIENIARDRARARQSFPSWEEDAKEALRRAIENCEFQPPIEP